MMTTTEKQTLTYRFFVPVPRVDEVQALVKKLAKKAARHEVLFKFELETTLETQKYYPPDSDPEIDGELTEVKVPGYWAEVEYEPLRIKGVEYVLSFEWVEGQALVTRRPLVEDEDELEKAAQMVQKPMCDHCGTVRARKTTYLFRNADGAYLQVGSTCAREYFGLPVAGMLEAVAEIARFVKEAEGWEMGERTPTGIVAKSYLAVAAMFVRVNGWMGRAKSREIWDTEGRHIEPTANSTTDYCRKTPRERRSDFGDLQPTQEDYDTAQAALEWAQALGGDLDDYLHNVHVVATVSLVPDKFDGVLASVIRAYERHLEKLEQQKVLDQIKPGHSGTVGKRQEFEVTLLGETGYDSVYGYVSVYRLLDNATGHLMVWKTTSAFQVESVDEGGTRYDSVRIGATVRIKATVKDHTQYRDTDQTVLTRVKVVG